MEIKTLKQYLEFFDQASKGNSAESYVLSQGRAFQAPKNARPTGIRKGRDKLCYMNAFRLADTGDFRYVEDLHRIFCAVYFAAQTGQTNRDVRLGIAIAFSGISLAFGINPESFLSPEDIRLMKIKI